MLLQDIGFSVDPPEFPIYYVNMQIDLSTMSPASIYHIMIQTIIPRPIAWVLSDNGNGTHNLAPFSFFTGVTSRPPLILFSVGRKQNGSKKDTWTNIEQRDHFVVHIPHKDLAGDVNASSADLPHGESEIDLTELETVPMNGFSLPRLKETRISMACHKEQIIEIGDGPQGLILGRVLSIYLDDDFAKEINGRIIVDPEELNPLARLGGIDYSLLGEILSIPRP